MTLGGDDRSYGPGERFEIPRGTPHAMANGGEPVRAIWRTTPAGRTLERFQALDRQARAGRTSMLDLGAAPAGLRTSSGSRPRGR